MIEGYIDKNKYEELILLVDEIGAMLYKIIK